MAEDELDSDARSLRNVKITMLISLLVVFVGGALAVRTVIKAPTTTTDKLVNKVLSSNKARAAEVDEAQQQTSVDGALLASTQELERLGATHQEIKEANSFNFGTLTEQNSSFNQTMLELQNDPAWINSRFREGDPGGPFKFPVNINIGAISIDGRKPIVACGRVNAPPDKSACLYVSWAANHFPQILRKFGPADLTGLEFPTRRPDLLMQEAKDWTRLRELSFFNSLLKAMPAFEVFDQSNITNDQLPYLERFKTLKSLGLCGPNITGRAILEMPILKRLETIKVKRIKDIQPLIETLPVLHNINEVWLVDQGITDDQVEILSNMTWLTRLRILRSKLTPDSFYYFKQMSGLKQLVLDRNAWSEADKLKFKTELKGCVCTFEPITDSTYWQAVVDDSKVEPSR